MRGLAEGTPELATEVRGGEMRGARERGDVQRLPVPGVDEILGAEQMTRGRMGDRHAPSIAPRGWNHHRPAGVFSTSMSFRQVTGLSYNRTTTRGNR